MTSSKEHGGYAFQCDACDAVLDPPRLGRGSESRDWGESWQEAKSKGWRAVQMKNGKWEHRCSDC